MKRLGIEGTISQAVRAYGVRRTRYTGLAKTHLQMVATAATINLSCFGDYLLGALSVTSRTSRFAAFSM
ncbi:MAG: transposase [Nitrospirae bacterium]|nr:transposase [Nitrospirota bacterium]